MFKAVAAKLAHSSTFSTLAGNPLLRPLQEVIAAEKLVLQSLQGLSTDFDNSSQALEAWASGEDDDLKDTFSACSILLGHWTSSLTSFAGHIARIRESLKAVRTREEALKETQARRTTLIFKSASADKKLNKMSTSDKNLRQQTNLSMSLSEHVRAIDTEIKNEEASLGDWKRTKAREWMGALFGGLLECSESGMIVATFGRTIVGYVSAETTQPGLPRASYSGESQVKSLVAEAERRLENITFVGEVGDKAELPSNNYFPGTIPRRPASPSSPLAQLIVTPPPQHNASHTLPNNSSRPELDELGGYSSHLRSQTYSPGQHIPPLDQLSPISLARSTLSLPRQGSPGFAAGLRHHLSQSSIFSGPDSIAEHTPPAPSLSFHDAPEINPTPSGSRSDIT